MVFNSWLYFAFFAVVVAFYVHLRRPGQHMMLLVAGCIFYGWWDWRFLFLVAFSTGIDYWAAIRMEEAQDERRRKRFLVLSVVSNLTILGFFKYFNFFVDNVHAVLASTPLTFDKPTLRVLLPVGISFYTFQAMSYTIDVYRDELRARRNLLNLATFPKITRDVANARRLLTEAVKLYASVAASLVSSGSRADAQTALDNLSRVLPSLPEPERAELTEFYQQLQRRLAGDGARR